MKKILFGFVYVLTGFLLNSQGHTFTGGIDISADRLKENVRILSSDEFEGRAPSTNGETKTINFLKNKLQDIGVKPGNGDSYFQEVALVKITSHAENVTIKFGDHTQVFKANEDISISTKQTKNDVTISNSDIVFVGYGAVAPEYDWNDYTDLDVKGKTVLILDRDPGHLSNDQSKFKGQGVTYYGRASYKYEEAKRQGAVAAFIIHDKDVSSLPWDNLATRLNRPSLSLDPDKINSENLKMQGYIPRKSVDILFNKAGLNYENEKAKALINGFRGYSLKAQFSAQVNTEVEKSVSHNVIGIIEGSETPDEYVIYTAHWDHLGTDKTLKGDQIYNGARDNASGTAGILELAQAHMTQGAPKRSVIFLMVTAEESGLLGSYYYALNPVYPLNKTVTTINMDTTNLYGQTRDVWVLGLGDSEMDDFIYGAIEQKQNKKVIHFPHPEWGIEYRGDHFSFNRMGIPSIVVSGGYDAIDPNNDIEAKVNDYDRSKYHKVSDEFTDEMDFIGAADDLISMFLIGNDVANSDKFPNWYAGKEFKPLRDAHMKEIGR